MDPFGSPVRPKDSTQNGLKHISKIRREATYTKSKDAIIFLFKFLEPWSQFEESLRSVCKAQCKNPCEEMGEKVGMSVPNVVQMLFIDNFI